MTAVVQTTNQSFDFNGESDLDLEYAMALTNPQIITLLQTGDIVEGLTWSSAVTYALQADYYVGAGFDNWLDAVDKSFCALKGGDDPTQVKLFVPPAIYHLTYYIGWNLPRPFTWWF